MKNILKLLLILISVVAKAQTPEELWHKESDWQAIKEKAIREEKYIFVDCFATWCVPCKQMDNEVFTNDTVNKILSQHFVSWKLQFDSTSADSKVVRNNLKTAKNFTLKYNIEAFPTLLCFSPSGVLLSKDLGYKSVTELISILKKAGDSTKSYPTLIAKYRAGARDYNSMAQLAIEAKSFKDPIADSIAYDYVQNYLTTLPDRELFTYENIDFITNAFSSSIRLDDKAFALIYKNADRINRIMKYKGLSELVIDNTINNYIVKPFVYNAPLSKPSWDSLKSLLDKKYDYETSYRNTVKARINYYIANNDWENYCKWLIIQVKKFGVGEIFADARLNDNAWHIFEHSFNRNELTIALSWINKALLTKTDKTNYANRLDTKANILYKLKKTKLAISVEMTAHKLDPSNQDVVKNMKKMKKNQPTWE